MARSEIIFSLFPGFVWGQETEVEQAEISLEKTGDHGQEASLIAPSFHERGKTPFWSLCC